MKINLIALSFGLLNLSPAIADAILTREFSDARIVTHCEIDSERVLFSLNESKIQIIRPHSIDLLMVDDLGHLAVSQAGKLSIRWMQDQLTYKFEAEEFFATGFTNIPNTSKASDTLKPLMDKSCDLESELYLFGDFDLALTIADKTYNDQVKIELDYSSARGEYTSPSGLLSKLYAVTYDSGHVKFEILVEEGETPYRLDFIGDFTSKDELSGSVFKKDGTLFGTFSGGRKNILSK